MKIKLKKLKLENFKGIKSLEIDFKEDVTNILADNGKGKTTIFDAYTWLLWDKDSLNRKDFSIKPYDKDGQEIHNLESTVEGTLEFDEEEIILKKVYKEIWTKKRGSTQAEFTGHTTDYYMNAVPVKKKEYTDRLATVIDEENFNLLSNPIYFNQILDKNKRRSIVLGLIEDIGKDEVLKENEDLKKLPLDKYTIDEIKAMAKDSAKKINKDIESIPARIDELEKSKVGEIDFDALEFRKNFVTPAIKEIDTKLADVSTSSDEIKEITSKISDLEQEKSKIKTNFEIENHKITSKNKNTLEEKAKDEKELQEISDIVARLAENIDDYRTEWVKINSSKYDGDFKCPTCGHDLEEHQIDEIIAKFNLDKSKKLENIEKEVEKIKARIEDYKKRIEELRSKKYEILEEIKLDEAKIQAIDDEIKTLKEKLSNLSTGDKSELIKKKEELTKELDELNKTLSLQGQNEKLDERIKELEKQEKDLAKSYEKQQEIIYLCEEYIKTYVDLVSDKINAAFYNVKIKLFEQQINGGITETCEVTLDGVPYSDLNSAGKINAGLDVINAISEKLDIEVPIFIDNAESINELIKTETQLVRLVVSKDKELRID
ncbi:AAA family ATPase [Peptoniphilus duerdenii]|uniref:AAA family ATPase n=1 Tax=Peptoniphilus duerdenii TaxID=507750 RepID=UPI0023F36ECF|nr:AAA family ATPase [Peptoniphilus duerdenii]